MFPKHHAKRVTASKTENSHLGDFVLSISESCLAAWEVLRSVIFCSIPMVLLIPYRVSTI